MNERIKELAKQAYEDVIENTPSFLVTKELYEQKFAELIVKQTMQVVANQLPSNQYLDVADAVLKHFGVEE